MCWPLRASIERTDHILLFMVPVSWCSCVTTWSKLFSSTPRPPHGRRNEVTQGDGQASLSLVAKISSGCRGLFWLCGTSERLPTQTTRDVWFGIICESSVESVWCIDQIPPYRVYIDSNRRDSWIWVPLVCGSHQVDNLMAWIMAKYGIIMLYYNYLLQLLLD
jgi:hypothetical protein